MGIKLFLFILSLKIFFFFLFFFNQNNLTNIIQWNLELCKQSLQLTNENKIWAGDTYKHIPEFFPGDSDYQREMKVVYVQFLHISCELRRNKTRKLYS